MNASIPLGSSLNCLESHHKPLPNGKRRVKFEQPRHQEDTEGIVTRHHLRQSNPTNQEMIPNPSSTPGSPVTNKSWTFKDKLLHCKPFIHTMKLSKTLDQESILREEASSPFWTTSLQEEYKKLWLPTETDFLDLDSTCSNTSLKGLKLPWKYCQIQTSKSLSTSWQKTSYRSLQFSQPAIMGPDLMKQTIKTRKIRIYPTKQQVVVLNKCLGASRFFYNKAVDVINQTGTKGTKILNLKVLRPLIMASDSKVQDDMIWQKEVPYDTRQAAIADAITAFKSCLTNKRNGNIDHFKVGFRSKKHQTTQVFKVNKKALNLETMNLFPRRKVGKLRLRKRDRDKIVALEGHPECDFTVLKVKPDIWYLCLPFSTANHPFENAVHNSCFLDPGVRTFQTFYSPDGICGKIGSNNFIKEVKDVAIKHDFYQSMADRKDDFTHRTRKHLKRRCQLLRWKLKNKVTDLHWQTCSFLCKTFRNIFIPRFEVGNMVEGSPLGSKVTRNMLQLSQGAFRERLIYYATTKHRNVYLVGEEYTTKTCGVCGHLQNVGGEKVYTCQSCNTKIDRDYNGARNVCLKLVSKFM